MMYQKAQLFGDYETADKILLVTTPKEMKDLGRQVKGFNEDIWIANREKIVYQGNYTKFTPCKKNSSRWIFKIND